MEFFVYASAIFNLASFVSRHQVVFTQPTNNIAATHNSMLWGQRSPFSPGLVSSHYVCPQFNCHQRTKKKRKRGGRIKPRPINVVTTGTSGQTTQNRSANKNNLITLSNTYEKKVSKELKVGLLNIQAVGVKENLIEDLILENELDMFFMTETWLKPSGDEVRVSALTPPSHRTVSCPRPTLGGGISLTSDKLLLSHLKSNPILNVFNSFECFRTQISVKCSNIVVFCIYRPPPSRENKLTIPQFMSEFEIFLDTYTLDLKNVLIIGDFNFHFECHKLANVKYIMELLEIRNFSQYIKEPTHKAGHTLDLVIAKNVSFKSGFTVSKMCFSDHYLITFQICFEKMKRPQRNIMSRDLRSIDDAAFWLDLIDINSTVLSSQNKAAVFSAELASALDRHAPLRARRVTDRPSAPWMTGDIKSLKADRRKAERRWHKTGLECDKMIFKSITDKLNKLITSSKKLFYEAKISASKTSKFLYQLVSNFYDKKKSSILPNNVPFNLLPNMFNDFFCSKISKIRSSFNAHSTQSFSDVAFSGNALSVFKKLSNDDVKELILSSPIKSCSLDPIPTALLVNNIDFLIDCITCIINDSLTSGSVPECLKHAIISPLLKKQNLDQNELKNYRPVSNLSFISKIIEKAVFHQMLNHLKSNTLLEKHQSAYRKCHNTETALLKIQNDLLLSADNKEISIIALLDLSAAFDTIDHAILLQRLKNTFGFEDIVLQWFRSYLSNRTQKVKINELESDPTPLLYGIPQGSILGPIIYTLYTTPLGNIIRNHNLNYHMYADDTQLYLSIEPTNVHTLIHSLENCIKDVKNWMSDNKLKLNDEKTEIILCNPKKYNVNVSEIKVGNDVVEFTDSARNLGVYFDKDLSLDAHFVHISKAVYLEIRRLKHMSKYVSAGSLKTLAASFILSRFDYCNSLFKNLKNSQLDKLQKLQNFAAKVILGKSLYDHVTPCLIELHWLPIKFRIDYKISLLVFKCLNGLAPPYLSELIEIYVPSRNLRSANLFLLKTKVTKYKTLGDRSFSYFAPTVWNALPIDIRQENSISIFKKKLKTFYFQAAFY